MDSNPLKNLIVNRGFDAYQSGLQSRFNAHRLEYELVYCQPTNKSAMYLDFESKTQLGRITVWVSGECEMEVLDKSNGESVFIESHHYKSEEEFFEGYPKLVVFMRESTNA